MIKLEENQPKTVEQKANLKPISDLHRQIPRERIRDYFWKAQ